MTRLSRLLPLAAAIALVAACGDDDSTAAPQPRAPEAVTITVLTHDSFAAEDSLLEAFTDRTGITIELLTAGLQTMSESSRFERDWATACRSTF